MGRPSSFPSESALCAVGTQKCWFSGTELLQGARERLEVGSLTPCCHSGTSSFNKYLLSTYCVSKPVLGAGDTEEPKIDFFLSLPLWKDLGRLKNRVMGVIWEVLRVRRPDPAAVGGGASWKTSWRR